MDEALKKKLSRLEAQCVKREYCVRDIMAKALKAVEGNQAEADELVASLRADKFVDDARYAAAFAREKSSLTGWGPVKIRFALRAKGLSETDIASGLAEIDSSRAEDRLERLTAAKWKSLQDDPQGKLKLIKFALSRGYDYDAVQAAISKLDI
ncbi:MAG: RecX family transcriptional regulator [Bacteroidales bacterium]|nr:RecX family transcriptional regulator [Bacteroidales bacterium]